MPKIVFLWTDIALYLLMLALILYGLHVRRTPSLRQTWARVAQSASAMSAAVVLMVFGLIAVLDSIHYRPLLEAVQLEAGVSSRAYSPVTRSLLDDVLAKPLSGREKTYSAPLAYQQFSKETVLHNGEAVRDFPRLVHGGAHLTDPASERWPDVAKRVWRGVVWGALVAWVSGLALAAVLAARSQQSLSWGWRQLLSTERDAPHGDEMAAAPRSPIPWFAIYLSWCAVCVVAAVLVVLSQTYHVLGTDSTGNDVLAQSLKSVRTAVIIGSITTLATLPLAVGLGLMAGYFKGWIDDLIQYLYTTLSSIPGVLLIAACVLMIQVFIDSNPNAFETGAERADIRLFLLCLILGLTGWAGLCRLLRAEVLRLRELDYVAAARAFGVPSFTIMRRHLLPNVMHIVLITAVLEFSALVLFEAVLSYLGVGVDPVMNSFGSMINLARLEMSRDPMVWWSLLSAFAFMLALVLSANLFADAVRDAFDPRARVFRPRWARFKQERA
ncbi:MAG: ABC transporter permease [Pigmentiphaga sp.]